MSPFARLSIFAIAVIGLLDAIWIIFGGFEFVVADLARTCVSVAILLSISAFYRYGRPVENFAVVTLWTSILIAFSAVAAVASYLFTSLGMPLQDNALVAFDEAIGFDWIGMLTFASQYPLLGDLTTLFYSSSLPLVAVTLIYLSFTGRVKRVELFITSLIIACLVTIVVSAPMAALGPYVYYNPPVELYQNFSPAVLPRGVDSPMFLHFFGLRDGSMRLLSLANMQGVITFPSFHTVMSVLMILALRGYGWVSWVAGIFNFLILLTVPLDGNHYFADMAAGIAVAVIAWYSLSKLQASFVKRRSSQSTFSQIPAMLFGPS